MRAAEAPAREPHTTRISATQVVSLRFYLRELWRRRGLVRTLAGRELKRDYEMNLVGFAWWLLEPLSLTLVYVIVVDLIFRRGGEAYPLFIVLGVLPWKWLSSTIIGAMGVVRGNANLITDVYFPRALLPAVKIVTGLAHFSVGLLIIPFFVLGFELAGTDIGVTWHLAWLPAVVAVQFLFTLGLSFPLAVWGLHYRNLAGVMQNLMRLWFYLTPIIWSMDRLENPAYRLVARLNPITGIIESYRGAILYHRSPDWTLAYTLGISLVTVLAGSAYFVRREAQFGKLI